MNSILKTGFAVLTLVSVGSSSWAQEVAQSTTPLEVVSVTPPKEVKFRGKALFNYPSEHPVSIVTFTQQDLEKLKQDRFMHDLKNATFSRKPASHIPPVAAD